MVTFSLGANSKRAANGSTDRRIVMQMAPKRATRHRSIGCSTMACSEWEIVSLGIVGAEFHQWEKSCFLRQKETS